MGLASTSTSISGCRSLKRPMRPTSQVAAKDALELITRKLRPFASRMARDARASMEKPSASPEAPAAPASVSRRPRPERSTRAVPISSSSNRTCCATAALVTWSSSAARANESLRATASKARKAFKEGKRCEVLIVYFFYPSRFISMTCCTAKNA